MEPATGMIADRATATARWLTSVDPRLALEPHAEAGCVVLRLPAAPGADYSFRLQFYEHEYTVVATPTDDPDAGLFWHQSIERMGAVSMEPVEQAFREFVFDLISHESRILHRRGMFFHRFICEVLRTAGWERVGGRILALRTRYRVPPMLGHAREYRAPALVAPDGHR